MRTAEEYRNDLLKLKANIYIGGKKVKRDDPRLRGGMNVISKTFELAENPDFHLTMRSHLTGGRSTASPTLINRPKI